jgi:phosphoglycerol transferase MdoB-like AlkP superfamily enzyme
MAGKYADPIEATGLTDPDRVRQLEHYARGLQHTDAATRRLIESLETSEERTILVFYGDHLPSVWPPAMLSRRTMHQTPFFVYANYGRPRVERLPTTSPIHFMSHVLEVADAPVTPYYALLQQLEQEVPAMGQGMLIGPDNRTTTAQELRPRARQVLRDYRLVQYDLAIGERYSAPEMLAADPDISPARF